MLEIIKNLEHFGLSTNAARAYCSLLKSNPATGYEISSQANIPRSAVYNVLNKLESMGMISGMGDKPKRYIPLSPSSLIEHLENSHQDSIEELKHGLEHMKLDEEAFDFWHIHGYKNLILKLKEAIKAAQEKLFISAWKREIDALNIELDDAEERGLEMTVFSFCALNKEYGKTISYGLDENKLQEIWSPKVIMVTDQDTTIMGSARDQDNSRAILTQNEAITEIATNHIILDITLAGSRMDFDPNPVVQRVLKRPDIHLDRLLDSK